MESRRCSERRPLLRHSKEVVQIYEYCLGYAAQVFNVELHGYVQQSNHDHPNFTVQKQGDGVRFRQLKNSLIARAINAMRGRRGALWSTADRDVMELVDEGAQVDALAYTLTNPIKDGLVKHRHQFPGAMSRPQDIGKVRWVKRPRWLFSKKMPEQVPLKLTLPPALKHLPLDEGIRVLEQAVADREQKIHAERAAKGLGYMGRRALLKQDPYSSPPSEQPFGKLNPRVKCADPQRRKARLEELKRFWQAHAEARARVLQGERDVVFPPGTFTFYARDG